MARLGAFIGAVYLLFVVAFLVRAGATPAQGPPAKGVVKDAAAAASPGAPGAPTLLRVTLRDGSVLRVACATQTLTVRTRLGTLTLPVAALGRLELGPRLAPDEGARLAALLAKMGSASHPEREAATAAVLALGPRAYHRTHAFTGDLEVRRRLDKVEAALAQRHGQHALLPARDDAFEAAGLKGSGVVQEHSLKLVSQALGTLEVPLCEVASLAGQGAGGAVTLEVKTGGQGATALTWVDTGVDLIPDRSYRLAADGQVELWPQTPGQYVAGPDGYAGVATAGLPAGCLAARVGPAGEPLRAGKAYTFTGVRGRLYLAVQPSPWNTQAVGFFAVSIYPE